MLSEASLRIVDALLALFWTLMLVRSIAGGRIGGNGGFKYGRAEKPGTYWFGMFIMALMVLHFTELAIVGQRLPA